MTNEQFEELKAMLAEALQRKPRVDPTPTPPVTPVEPVAPPDMVLTPRGRMFPRPKPELGEMFMGYTMRVGDYIGGEVQMRARNSAGALFITATPLFAKHGGFKSDGSNWAAAAEEHLFGDPFFVPDPAWGSYRPGRL